MTGRDDLIGRARERAEASPVPDFWGYRLALEPGDAFVGRWRGETTDEANEDRRVFLFWDEDEEVCFSRLYTALGREIDLAAPTRGCTIVIVRGDDYTAAQGTGYSYGVVSEANDRPLPEETAQRELGVDFPF
jgi:hypothetical protein